jgi:uncharacterized protein CbrC (UPF0167 family)
MKMKNKIATYAAMASAEAHDEYMAMHDGYMRDILDEVIAKFDNIEAMARRKWYTKLFR